MIFMNWTIEDIKEVFTKLNERALSDQEFRELCLQEPKKAFEQVCETPIPTGFDIQLSLNENGHLTPIPLDKVSASGRELSDEELEQVSAAGFYIGDEYWRTPCVILDILTVSLLTLPWMAGLGLVKIVMRAAYVGKFNQKYDRSTGETSVGNTGKV